MHLNRGNHEDNETNIIFGFRDEVIAKYDKEVYCEFESCFKQLPLIHILNKKVMVVHGGIPCFYTEQYGTCVKL